MGMKHFFKKAEPSSGGSFAKKSTDDNKENTPPAKIVEITDKIVNHSQENNNDMSDNDPVEYVPQAEKAPEKPSIIELSTNDDDDQPLSEIKKEEIKKKSRSLSPKPSKMTKHELEARKLQIEADKAALAKKKEDEK